MATKNTPTKDKTKKTNCDGLLLRGSIWHLRFTVKGVPVSESTHTSNRREAERIRDKRRSDIVQAVLIGNLKLIKLHDAIDLFQKSRRGLASHNNAIYQTEPFKALSNTYLHSVVLSEAQDLLEERTNNGYKKSTNALTVTYFNAMVNFCAKHKYSVCEKLERIKGVQSKIRWLTEQEEESFFAAMDSKTVKYARKSVRNDLFMDENSDICLLLTYTGARWHEAANMTWSQVNFNKNTVHVIRGKGSNDTTLSMNDKLARMLRKRRDADLDGDHVFSRHLGKQCAVAWFRAAVKRAKLSSVDGTVTPHTFRHTFAARLLHNGLSLVELQEMLGHKNIQTTMIYKHLQPGRAATRTAAIFNKIDSDREEVAVIKAAGVLTPEQVAAAYVGNVGQ